MTVRSIMSMYVFMCQPEVTAMAKSMVKSGTQRRVYVLPDELVGRILAFQRDTGLPSETEAARRLLDEALKRRDTYKSIIERFLNRFKEIRILSDVAKEVLAGHPLISTIRFEDDAIHFRLINDCKITINTDGVVDVEDDKQGRVLWGEENKAVVKENVDDRHSDRSRSSASED